MKKVTIYSTPTCHFCAEAKTYLKENNVPFEDVNVAADRARLAEMMDKSGQQGVPVIVIGEGAEEEIIVGFDKPHVMKALGLDVMSMPMAA